MKLFRNLLLLLTVFLAWSCGQKQAPASFSLSAEELLDIAQEKDFLVAPSYVIDAMEKHNPDVLLVDIRPAAQYRIDGLKTAINIPTQNLMEQENLDRFENTEAAFVLYGNDTGEANGPWMLLRQMGFQNVKILQGGLQYLLAASDQYAAPEDLPPLQSETARYDYLALLDSVRVAYQEEMQIKADQAASAPRQAPAKKILPKRKAVEEEEEEGC